MTTSLLAILLLLPILVSSAAPSRIGMSYVEFNEILKRECRSEMEKYSTDVQREEMWNAANIDEWEEISLSDETTSFPFLITSKKEGSGHSRKLDILENLFDDSDNNIHLEAVYNGGNKTVFAAQVMKDRVYSIKDKISNDDSFMSVYSFQVLLPMCKLNHGIVDSAKERFLNGIKPATLTVRFGEKLNDDIQESFFSDVESYDLGDEDKIQRCFPFSWSLISDGLDFDALPTSVDDTTFTSGSSHTIRLKINRLDGKFKWKELLSLISSIASRHDVKLVELTEDITIGLGFDDEISVGSNIPDELADEISTNSAVIQVIHGIVLKFLSLDLGL